MPMTAYERCKAFGAARIQGIAYMPGPTNYTKQKLAQYFDSDFYNSDFEALWGYVAPDQGRQDLARFKDRLGINFIHCYDWSAPAQVANGPLLRDHRPFIASAAAQGQAVTIPISNYTLTLILEGKEADARANVEKVYREIYPNQAPLKGAAMWKIFNEFDLNGNNPETVVTVIGWIVDKEDKESLMDGARLPIMVDTSFGLSDGVCGGAIKGVWQALKARGTIGHYTADDFWRQRFVFATNPQNDGPFIVDYLRNTLDPFWNSIGAAVPPVMFTELGSNETQTGGEAQQAAWLKAQIEASTPGLHHPLMLGACVFLNEERVWEQGPELTFGIMRFGDTAANDWPHPSANHIAGTTYPQWDRGGHPYPVKGSYPVERQMPKLNYTVVRDLWAHRAGTH